MTHFFLNQHADIIGWRNAQPVSRAVFLARIADWHAALAILPGKQFALHLHDRIEFAAALLGAWQAGKVIWLSADALGASVDALRASVDGFIGNFPPDCFPVIARTGNTSLGQLMLPAHDFVGLVVHTSGTNGVAQAIPKKIGQLTSEVATLEQLFGTRIENADIVATVSHQHIYGLLFTVLWPLHAGHAISAETFIYPEQVALQLALRPSALISSPAHLKRQPQHLNWPHCQVIFCSGGVLSAEVALANAKLLGSVPVEVYGSSESGGIAWRQRKSIDDDSWHAMPNVTWRVEPESQCIQIRSPHLFTDDWLMLADRIQHTEDNHFVLLGRTDRIVKIEEKRISLDAIEQALLESGLVAEIRLIADPIDHAVRQQIAAVVVLSESGQKILREQGKLEISRQLKQRLQQAVELVAIPRRWRFVDSLPVNTQGKTTQALMRALFHDTNKMVAPSYTELERNQNQAEFEVQWLGQLRYFDGHFPDAPVLPGVAQVHWAIRIGREAFAISTAFQSMHGLKFR